uniref:Uncharacterized protein n=1 Tax=Oryza rufipogon TaxID=4529 RepID=A0A0E0NI21_ORYRU
MVQIDDEASSMVRSSLNGLDWLPDADGGIGVGDADSEGSWVAADSGDWWLEDQRRQRLHPVHNRNQSLQAQAVGDPLCIAPRRRLCIAIEQQVSNTTS